MSKQILILAGPNGAGKTTFAREFLMDEASCPTFLNADIIAAELSPQRPEQVAVRAARFMLQRIREEVAKGQSFAFETTLANRSYAHSIREWQAAGYHGCCTTIPMQTQSC
jgi:predicted ABC-type ATPase